MFVVLYPILVIVFGALAFSAQDGSDFYYAFPLWLYNGGWLWFLIIAGGVLGVIHFLIHQAIQVEPKYEPHAFGGFLGAGLVLVIPWSLAGMIYNLANYTSCTWGYSSLMHCVPQYLGPLFMLGGPIIVLIYLVGFVFGISAVLAHVISAIPAIVTGFTVLTTTHPAAHSVSRAASHDRPTSVHKELARIMERQEIDDQRASALIDQMNPLSQIVYRARFSKRIREAKRLREMVDKRVQSMREDTRLAESTLEMERRKRDR